MSKLTLKQMILNVIDDKPRGFAEELAKQCSYASGSNLKKVLVDEKKEFEKFYGLVKLVQTLFPEDEATLMADYALTLDPKKQSARFMLEYLENNQQLEAKRELIRRMLECSNSKSKEWAMLYNIDDKYVKKEISFTKALGEYSSHQSKSIELEIGYKIYKGYCLLDEQMFGILDQSINGLDMDIIKISDDYIREMYYSRYMILSIVCKVSRNRIEEARELANKVIENIEDNYYKALASLHLGNSYLMGEYDKANQVYIKGLEFAQSPRCEKVRANIERSLNFLNNLNGKQPNHLNLFSSHPADVHEVAFYYIKHKQYFKANETLDKMNFDDLNDVQKGFHHYYRGLIGDSIKHFSKSIVYFRKAGDYYFRKFPLLELEKLGLDINVIEALAI